MFRITIKKIIVIAICLSLAMLTASSAFSDSKYRKIGKSELAISAEKDIVIAKVNGVPINNARIERQLMRAEMLGSPKSKKQIIDREIKIKSVIYEAKKLDLYPDNKQTELFINDIKNNFNVNEEAKSQFIDYLNGLGKTEEEYFKEHYDGYADMLAFNKLYEKITENETDVNKKAEIWENYMNELVSKANIDILSSSHFQD